jgi:hypothetical protein
VAHVPGVLLEQVEQDPLEGRRVGTVPALAQLAHLVERVGGDDGAAPRGLDVQPVQQRGGRLFGPDGPAALRAALVVSPRVAHVPALEAPLQPAQLDVAQVLDQFERRPARRQPTPPLLFFRQREQLGGQP